MVDGDLPPSVKKDAHDVILDFIRSRPPLKPVKHILQKIQKTSERSNVRRPSEFQATVAAFWINSNLDYSITKYSFSGGFSTPNPKPRPIYDMNQFFLWFTIALFHLALPKVLYFILGATKTNNLISTLNRWHHAQWMIQL